ncbi:MAG: type II toxin-antitoxin system HicA family toxin [Taibaiella sp.]|nr:type II toxin-antitoxin system HicA family toxin [Taibaiella sp.]
MKIPRDLSGKDLIHKLEIFGYAPTRQSGSHIRLTTQTNGEHHITIPNHEPIRIGTLSAILDLVAAHLQIERKELQERLFG